MKALIFYFCVLMLLVSCGQQSEVLGPHQRVEYDDNLVKFTIAATQALTGLCDPGSALEVSSPGIVGSPLSLNCDPQGQFSTLVNLTSGDGDKLITISQTAVQSGVVTTDTFTVNLDQNPPTVTPDVAPTATYGSGQVLYNVLSNDVDLGRGLDYSTLRILTNSANGSCSIFYGAVPVVAFMPDRGFSGTTSCTYEVADLLGLAASTTVDFVVGPSNPVTANDNTVAGTQNIQVALDVVSDDLDPDGSDDIDLSTLTIVTPTNSLTEGTCSVGPTPSSLTFVPVLNYFGTAVCTYEVCDFAGNCDQANLSVIVPDLTSPVASKDVDTMLSGGTPVTRDVASNDLDPANNLDASSVQVLSATGGVCNLSPTAPNIQFVPNAGFVGLAGCNYQICDTSGNCTTGVYEVTVNDGQAPNTNNDLALTSTNQPTSPINVSLNDLDPESRMDLSSVTIVGGTEVGGTCAISPASPLVIFTPSTNVVGVGGCDYQICDTSANCSTASIVVTVNDVLAPVAVLDTATTTQNTVTAAMDLSANDSDAEGNLDPATVVLTGVESGGSCAMSPAAPNVVFTPDVDFAGIGSCGYRICDSYGNCSTSSFEVTVNDITAPTVTINQLTPGQLDPTNSTPITFMFAFSEPIDGASLTSSDVDTAGTTATGGIYAFTNTGDNQNFLLQVSALGSEGVVQVSLPVGSFTDVNGVSNTAAASIIDNSVTFDNVSPLKPVVLTPAYTMDATPDVEVSCEPASLMQINVPGLAPQPYPAAPLTCPGSGTVVFSGVPLPLGSSPYAVTAVASDLAGNQTLSDVFDLVVDVLSPDVDIIKLPDQADSTNALPIFFQATFSEPIDPLTFNPSDVVNTGTAPGGVWTVSNSGDNQTFTLSVNALTGDGTVVPSVAASLVSDLAGNLNTSSTSSGVNTVTYDGTDPLAPIITGPFYTQNPTPTLVVDCDNSENLEFVITPYTGTNPVTAACSAGVASVAIPSNLGTDGTYAILPTAIDDVGNRTDGNLFNLVLDRVSPTPTITLNSGQATLTKDTPIFFDVAWDEPIDPATFTGVDITNTGTATGGVWSVANSGDNQNFILSVTSLTSNGTISPSIAAGSVQDFSVNLNLVGSYTGTAVELDTQAPDQPVVTGPQYTALSAPSITLTCDTASSQVSLIVPGYAGSPVAAGACVSGSLSVTLSPALASEGVYTITPTATDAAGNLITGAPFDMVYDATAPTLVINRLGSQPTQSNLLPISFEVQFSEKIDPATFSATDVSEIHASPAPGGLWSVTNSGDNQNFTISKSGLTGDGFVQPQIAIGVVADLTGNTNTAANTVGANGDLVEYIITPPDVPTVTGPKYTNTLSPTVTVECEVGSLIQLAISGYTPNPYPASPLTCSASPLSVALSPAVPAEGVYTIRAISSDFVGNQSVSAPFSMTVDTTAPTVLLTQASGQLDPTRLLPIKYDVVFSEPIDATTFTAADILNVGSTSGGGSWSITNSGDNQNFVISISGLTSDGTVEPGLLASVVQDPSGNNNIASPVPAGSDIEVAYDGTPPGIPSILSPRYTNNDTPSISVSCEVGSLVQVESATINGGVPFPASPLTCSTSPMAVSVPSSLADGDYLLTARSSDNVGNTSFSSTYTMTIDTVRPDVNIDRLASVTPDRTNSEPVVFSVTFSEPIQVSTFTSVAISNAAGALTPGLWSVTNSGDNQNFTISASAIVGEGDIEPQILSGVVSDLSGNTNTIYTVLSDGDVFFDNIAPSESLILSWAWVMSSPVSGVYSTDNTPQFALSGAAAEEGGVIQVYDDSGCVGVKGSAVAVSSGVASITDISYLTDGTQDGLKVFYVKVTDDVGNTSSCVPISQSYTFDTTAPVATLNQAPAQLDPAKELSLFFEVNFNEEINPSTFDVLDLSSAGTIASLSYNIINSGDDKKFTVEVHSPDTGGTVVLELASNSVEDLAGNLNTATNSTDNSVLYDCVNPESVNDLYYGPVTKTTVDLFWTPRESGCQPIRDYEIEYRETGGAWAVFSDGVNADPLTTVTSLTPDTEYEFRIRSFNDLYSAYSNVTVVSTKPDSPFFDPADYKLINLAGATDSTVVALEDSTDIYITMDVNDPAPPLLVSLDAGQTHRFTSVRGEIMISDKPIFATGRIGSYTFGCSGSGNPPWVSPLWSERTLLFNASRSSPQTVYVYAFQDSNVTIYRNNAVVVPSTFIAENTLSILSASGTGAFRIESDGFVVATRHGTSFVDDMPALPKSKRIMGYPSSSGLLSTVGASIPSTIYHSDGFTLTATLNPTSFTAVSPRGSPTSLYRSEAVFIEADDLISANNTADSDGCNSAPFNPIELMMRRYAVNVDAQYVAFASLVPAKIKMIRPDGTEAQFELARTGVGPFATESPYKFYLTNVDAGTRFEGLTPQDRYSVWYQSDTRDGAGYEDETIIYGYK